MIKTFCDVCGIEIKEPNSSVLFSTKGHSELFQVCNDCYYDLIDKVRVKKEVDNA